MPMATGERKWRERPPPPPAPPMESDRRRLSSPPPSSSGSGVFSGSGAGAGVTDPEDLLPWIAPPMPPEDEFFSSAGTVAVAGTKVALLAVENDELMHPVPPPLVSIDTGLTELTEKYAELLLWIPKLKRMKPSARIGDLVAVGHQHLVALLRISKRGFQVSDEDEDPYVRVKKFKEGIGMELDLLCRDVVAAFNVSPDVEVGSEAFALMILLEEQIVSRVIDSASSVQEIMESIYKILIRLLLIWRGTVWSLEGTKNMNIYTKVIQDLGQRLELELSSINNAECTVLLNRKRKQPLSHAAVKTNHILFNIKLPSLRPTGPVLFLMNPDFPDDEYFDPREQSIILRPRRHMGSRVILACKSNWCLVMDVNSNLFFYHPRAELRVNLPPLPQPLDLASVAGDFRGVMGEYEIVIIVEQVVDNPQYNLEILRLVSGGQWQRSRSNLTHDSTGTHGVCMHGEKVWWLSADGWLYVHANDHIIQHQLPANIFTGAADGFFGTFVPTLGSRLFFVRTFPPPFECYMVSVDENLSQIRISGALPILPGSMFLVHKKAGFVKHIGEANRIYTACGDTGGTDCFLIQRGDEGDIPLKDCRSAGNECSCSGAWLV